MKRIRLNVDLIYPIGSIYMSIKSTNPSTYFGGTWTAWGSGRVPVGVDTSQTEFKTVEKTGGSKTHTLTVDEIPEHNHGIPMRGGNLGGWTTTQMSDGAKQYSGLTDVSGGGKPHDNLPPYITCYMWKRTA